jgi:hypothetical protein|uniref:Uncharacterized protein n=2 Tax=Picea TaxID=3328 RepID=A0A101LVI8_PICGL|nr:hypothetical protein ABT39_MTgene1927 [Picea glauca]QHR89914.1 hypothetical protein Q903MT_gene3936 [Picea sitchensis]
MFGTLLAHSTLCASLGCASSLDLLIPLCSSIMYVPTLIGTAFGKLPSPLILRRTVMTGQLC